MGGNFSWSWRLGSAGGSWVVFVGSERCSNETFLEDYFHNHGKVQKKKNFKNILFKELEEEKKSHGGPQFRGDLEAVYSASLANLLHVTGSGGELAPAGRETAGECRDGPGAGGELGSYGPPGRRRRRRKTPVRWVRAPCVLCGLFGSSRGSGRCRPRGVILLGH